MADQNPTQVVTAFMSAMDNLDFDAGFIYITDNIECINNPGNDPLWKR